MKNLTIDKIAKTLGQIGEFKTRSYPSWNNGYRSDFTIFTMPYIYYIDHRPKGGKSHIKSKISDLTVKFQKNDDGTFNYHQTSINVKQENCYAIRKRVVNSFVEKLEGLINEL